MFTRSLPVIFCCTLTVFYPIACATQTATKSTPQKKTFNSCASIPSSSVYPGHQARQTTADKQSAPLKLADNKPAHALHKPAAATRTITVKSKITNDMLGYKKFGKHYPDKEFKIFINGKELVTREEIRKNKIKTMKTPIKGDTLDIVFRYEFNHIWRNKGKGTRQVAFKIPPTTDTVELTFNWKTDSQVLIENSKGVTFIPHLSDKKQ